MRREDDFGFTSYNNIFAEERIAFQQKLESLRQEQIREEEERIKRDKDRRIKVLEKALENTWKQRWITAFENVKKSYTQSELEENVKNSCEVQIQLAEKEIDSEEK